MAVFHFKLQLVPSDALCAPAPHSLTADELDAGADPQTGWWASRQPAPETLRALRALLPVNESWGVEEYTEGDKAGSDLRIWSDEPNGPIWCVTFRFSSVTDDWPLMTALLTIARQARCLLIEEQTGAILPADEKVVRSRYVASRAYRFRLDPEAVLKDAAEQVEALESLRPR